MLSLHRKLVSEKRLVIAQFAPPYKRLVQALETKGMKDDKLAGQLSATRQVLQDAG